MTIADEETPLAANGAQESSTIADEETPLAAEAGAVENMQQEKMSWWWLLIIALLGVTGEEMYRRNKKKKAEAAQKDEEINFNSKAHPKGAPFLKHPLQKNKIRSILKTGKI